MSSHKADTREFPPFSVFPDRRDFREDLQSFHDDLVKRYKVLVRSPKKPYTYNIPCTFDTETSSFYDNGKKVSILCEWTATILNHVYIGRSCAELVEFFDTVGKVFCRRGERIVFYVHNLAFDFAMISRYFDWENVFAVDRKKPVYALMRNGIELRCSYILTGYSLTELGKKLKKYPARKRVGDWDYNLIRTPETPITETEIGYCIADCITLAAYIQEQIEREKTILRIPLTKTGYIRRLCRDRCLKESYHYRRLMKQMKITVREYLQLRRTYQGGYTHANAFYSGISLNKVGSIDFCSAYPYVMVSEMFPMSKAHYIESVTLAEFNRFVRGKTFRAMFDVSFDGIHPKAGVPDSYISSSHCRNLRNAVLDNGRVSSAEHLETSITDVDFEIIERCYEWEEMKVCNFCWYDAGYLPKSFIMTVLELYEKKTKLKGVTGLTEEGLDAEEELMKTKELLNSCYGMLCTDPCQEINEYSTEWEIPRMPDIEEAIEKYNDNPGRFSVYSWGIWVCALCRKNLWFGGILQAGDDYVYSDTDSVKMRHFSAHRGQIEKYNDSVREKLIAVSEYYKIPFEMFAPKNIKGKEKMLGVFEYEGYYEKYKAIHAKCYMFRKRGKWSITVSGLNKKAVVPYMRETFKGHMLEEFGDGMHIPAGKTGKLTHTYIEEPREGVIIDKDGICRPYSQLSGVHMEGTFYTMGITEIYRAYIMAVRHKGGVLYV